MHRIRKETGMYPDSQGWLHPTQEEALRENQRVESDFSRGASGECPQSPNNLPPPPPPPKPSK